MANTAHTNLFDKYGGVPTVRRLVKEFYERVFAKPTLRRYFDGVDRTRLVEHQAELIAYAMGKPSASFNPQRLSVSHHGRGITLSAYEDVINILRQVLLDANVEGRDIAEILNRMDMQRHRIVRDAPPVSNVYDPEQVDPLTGLGSRAALDAALAVECAKFRERGQPLSLAMMRPAPAGTPLPLDAHTVQMMERHLAGTLARTVREADLLCRCDDGVFCLVLRGTGDALAMQAAERIRKVVAQDIFVSHAAGLRIDLAVGLASAGGATTEPMRLIAAAGSALAQAMSAGEPRIVADNQALSDEK